MRKVGLVTKFVLLSLVLISALGVILARDLAAEIRSRALRSATETAVVSSELGFRPQLTIADIGDEMPLSTRGRLGGLLSQGAAGTEIVRIKIFNRAGKVLFSDDKSIEGAVFPIKQQLASALAGTPAADIDSLELAENASERPNGKLLEVYVPLTFGSSPTPAGAFELYLPYAPVAAAIHHDTTRLYILLGIGLGLLWLALSRIVLGASRRLRKQAAASRHQARHDALTDLPNRALFGERLDDAISAGRRAGASVAVLLIDLDRFKEINDTLGHSRGDALLRQVGPRLQPMLQPMLRPADTVARLGGDEFAICLSSAEAPAAALALAGEIRHVLSAPFDVGELAVELEASIGVTIFPDHGHDAETLLRRAEVAMYRAKSTAAGIELYNPEHDGHSRDRLNLVGDLRRAIERQELLLHYQPKVDLRTGRAESAEALVRWDHPTRGLVFPDEFIPLAEHTGLIRPLTDFVLDEAMRQCKVWRAEGIDLTIAVNLSVRTLHDLHFPDQVRYALARHGLPASALELEITESTLMTDPQRAVEVVQRLHVLGVQFAIDDFGTGYSSLAYLQRLPVAAIKIDKSFVLGLGRDGADDTVIVRSTIDLARNLGIQVIAEGVETDQARQRLVELGCDLAQGYLLCRPVPPAELVAWLRDHDPVEASPASGRA
jgi:diguanylate cyclase (GGDEF)-like protein